MNERVMAYRTVLLILMCTSGGCNSAPPLEGVYSIGDISLSTPALSRSERELETELSEFRKELAQLRLWLNSDGTYHFTGAPKAADFRGKFLRGEDRTVFFDPDIVALILSVPGKSDCSVKSDGIACNAHFELGPNAQPALAIVTLQKQ